MMISTLLAMGLAAQLQAAVPAPERKPELAAKALSILRNALSDDDGDVRALSVQQWGRLGNQAVVPSLRGALKDPNRYVRIAAAESLHRLGDKSGIAVLASIIGEKPAKTKKSAAPGPVEELRNIARNKVRVAAIHALSLMDSTGTAKVLSVAKEDPDGSVRDAAAAALARAGAEAEINRFVDALESDDPGERLAAVRRLGDIALPATLIYLKRMAKDPDAQVRAAAMSAIGATGSLGGITELQRGLGDGNDLVRTSAVEALGRLKDPEVTALLKGVYETSGNLYLKLLAVEGLARANVSVDLGVAQRGLYQKDVDTRLRSVEVLEIAGGEWALDMLELTLDDASPKVRVRAAAALIQLLKKK